MRLYEFYANGRYVGSIFCAPENVKVTPNEKGTGARYSFYAPISPAFFHTDSTVGTSIKIFESNKEIKDE